MTACATVFGVFHASPGLGIALAVLSAPALIRTAMLNSIWKRAGQPLTLGQKILSFLGSLLVVVLIVVSTCCAFLTTCFPLGAISFGFSNLLGVGAWVLGILAGVLVCGSLVYELWIKFLVRWKKTQQPPTWNDRVRGLVQNLLVTLLPFAGGLGAVALCSYLPALFDSPFANSVRDNGGQYLIYFGGILVFCASFATLRCLSFRFHRAMYLLTATLLGAIPGLYLGGIPGLWIGRALNQDQPFLAIGICAGIALGGIGGFLVAWRFPVAPPDSDKSERRG
jgi:hypothetical protein